MKNIVKITLFVICIFIISPSCFALESNVDEYNEEFNYQSIIDSLDSDTVALLEEMGITEISYESIFGLSMGKIFNSLFNLFTDSVSKPLSITLSAIGIIIITAVIKSFCDDEKMVSLIGGGALSLTLAVPFATTVTTAFSVLDSLLVFTSAFSGVFCAIVSSSGNLTSGAVYGTVTVFADTFFSGLLAKLSQPVVNVMCSLGFLSCFDSFSLSERITSILKKGYVFLLSLAGTVFSGLVTLKGVLSSGVDSLSSRSVRFVIGQSLPVVGGAVSETYSSLITSLGLIKNTVGGFGILTIFLFVLPVLIDLFLWSICFEVISLFSQSFATENGMEIINVFKNIITLLSATIIILATIFVVCIGVCIAARSGEV